MKFSGVITIDKRYFHAKGQGHRSKVKVTEVMTPLRRFRTLTPVWIGGWPRNLANSLNQLRRGSLLFFKVIRRISRSQPAKKFADAYEIPQQLGRFESRYPIDFQGHPSNFKVTRARKVSIWPNFTPF